MNWEIIKEHANKWYGMVGQFLLFQNIVFYLFCCATYNHPVGLTTYIEFLNHCCHR